MDMWERYARLVAEGVSSFDLLNVMCSDGVSPIAAIRVLVDRLGISLKQAKQLVHDHPGYEAYKVNWAELDDLADDLPEDKRQAC
jgi:hypothetical protein